MSAIADDLRTARRANRLALERVRAANLDLLERRVKRQLRESMSLDWVSPYAELLDRFRYTGDPVFAGPTSFWQRRYGRNWPIFQTEQELSLLRAPARLLCATTDDAIGLINGISAYVIGPGITYRPAIRQKDSEFPKPVVDALQRVIDDILEANEWRGGENPGIETEAFWRSLEDGEFILVDYPQEDGTTVFRFHEPEGLTQPPGESEYDWLFGVCTDPMDTAKVYAYWLQLGDTPSEGEEYGPDRVVHFKRNGRRGQKRGLTDFCFSTYDKLSGASKLRGNMLEAAAEQAAIVGVRQHDNGSEDDIQRFVDADADYTQTVLLSGRQEGVRITRKGSWEDIPKGLQYVDGPGNVHADKHLAILDACLRGAVTRWNGFEWLISANAGNNNLPTDLSAESPFVRRVLMEQTRYKNAFKRPIWRAVEHHVRTNGLVVAGRDYSWEEIASEVDLLVEAPNPQTRNKLEETQRAAIEIPLGVDSRQRYMQDQGRDVDQIEADNQAWNDEHGNDGAQLPLDNNGGDGDSSNTAKQLAAAAADA